MAVAGAPAIIDPDGPNGAPLTLFESVAILFYLAEKTGALLPSGGAARHQTMQWLMFQAAGVGPMLGQVNFFRKYYPMEAPYALDRYTKKAGRLYHVMEAAPWPLPPLRGATWRCGNRALS